MVKYQPFCYKLVVHEIKKITSFNLIRLHLQKKIILEMFVATPHRVILLFSEQEMDLASVFAMNFMKVFFLFLLLEQGSRPLESHNPSLTTPTSIVPIRAANSAATRALFQGGAYNTY